MLTLTRKTGQAIVIETEIGNITIVLKEIRRTQVRLGIEAPRSVNVDREEVYEARKGLVEAAEHIAAVREQVIEPPEVVVASARPTLVRRATEDT